MRPRILIVDNNPNALAFLVMYFETEGFEVYRASDGLEGLHVAERVHPEALIFDYHLPAMDGLTMLAKIREAPWAESLVVVLYTSGARKSALDRAGHLDARLWKGFHTFR